MTQRLARGALAVTVCYLLATAVLIVAFGHRLQHRWMLFVAHVAGAAMLLVLEHFATRYRLIAIVRDWHPILLFPLFYKEVERLAAAFGDWRLTSVIPEIEAKLFAGQPSMYLSERWNLVLLSEFLHFCYLSYVIIIPAVAGYWYMTNRRVAFHELVLLLTTAMLGSYLFFMLFPVDSPYYLAPRLGAPLAGHVFFDLVHAISDRGGARGGAFPSAHVTGAVVVWLVAGRHERRLALALTPVVLGLVVATVYGRFHYVLDCVAGATLAATLVVLYHRTLERFLNLESNQSTRTSKA